MTTISSTQLFVVLLMTALLSHVAGHSYMTSPVSRSNQAQTQSGCRGPTCMGPCDVPLAQARRAPIVASRGDAIRVDWPRNNHAGGFIRFAWAPTSQSDSHAAFDNHVQQINCHEIGNPTPGQCAPADPVSDPNGGGSGPGDGSSGACNINITVPLDLTDGTWTLQWAWFGGAFALGDYFSCADYRISGGAVGTLTPVFIGGDYSYPNQQKCKFFNTDKLHVCTSEPCQAPIYFGGAKSGVPAAGQLGSTVSVTIPPVSVTVPPVSTPVTTGAVRPSTTGAVRPSTTGSVRPSTTGSVRPSTTASQPVSVPTPVPAPVPTPVATPTPAPVTSNCAGVSTVSTSTARIVSVDAWGSQFHALVEITVDEAILSDWVLEVNFPFAAQVVRFFNGGALQCSSSTSSYFMPAASWSNNVRHGSTIQVEFIATNPAASADFITANTALRVLKN